MATMQAAFFDAQGAGGHLLVLLQYHEWPAWL